jgi:hypothetical protein
VGGPRGRLGTLGVKNPAGLRQGTQSQLWLKQINGDQLSGFQGVMASKMGKRERARRSIGRWTDLLRETPKMSIPHTSTFPQLFVIEGITARALPLGRHLAFAAQRASQEYGRHLDGVFRSRAPYQPVNRQGALMPARLAHSNV